MLPNLNDIELLLLGLSVTILIFLLLLWPLFHWRVLTTSPSRDEPYSFLHFLIDLAVLLFIGLF
ncbi:MAG: hypothetical protein OEY97_07420 [Nitrospirota bacterium]|nr:hypothetical protein [Nitrospirota bacterium]